MLKVLVLYAVIDSLIAFNLWHSSEPRHHVLAALLGLCSVTLVGCLVVKNPERLRGAIQAALLLSLIVMGAWLRIQYLRLGFVDAVSGMIIVAIMGAGLLQVGQLRGWPIRLS